MFHGEFYNHPIGHKKLYSFGVVEKMDGSDVVAAWLLGKIPLP
jgi:hypothetical protein